MTASSCSVRYRPNAPPGNPAESSACTSNEVWHARACNSTSAFDTLSNLACGRGWAASAPSSAAPFVTM